ncbi:hypothetical protein BpHYR1_030648 [Brachionus plicatilis]|uniref:Uncharacterized protein n=1 Tax=Brachionus plicatilis TaxID=10195 RepID=A0A3M7Q8Z3_BRAPC|nr:hypothetical protein BpHYR1_030648 [Brachionus plicatilis]
MFSILLTVEININKINNQFKYFTDFSSSCPRFKFLIEILKHNKKKRLLGERQWCQSISN